MKRRAFLTTTALATLSTTLLQANEPTTLQQWLTQNSHSNGTIKLYPHNATEKLSQLSNLIDSPLNAAGNKLNFLNEGTPHQLTLKIAA